MQTFGIPALHRRFFAVSPCALKLSLAVIASLVPAYRPSSAAPLVVKALVQVAAATPTPVAVVYYVGTGVNASDTNSGTLINQPLATLQAAHAKVKPGDTVNIGPGLYRQSLTITKSGTAERPIRWFVREPLNTQLTGADIVDKVVREPKGVYSFEFSHKFIGWCGDKDENGNQALNKLNEPRRAHPCNKYHEVIGRAEQVLVEGKNLTHVLKQPAELLPGEFYFSASQGKVYLRDRSDRDLTALPPDSLIETSKRTVGILLQNASYNHLQGFHVTHVANKAQSGAVEISGINSDHNVLRRFKIEKASGDGLALQGKRHLVANSIFSENGSVGVSGGALFQLIFANNKVTKNNTKRYDSNWQAGGMKICAARDSLFRENLFEENYGGPGLWFDISVDFVEIDRNVFHKNEQSGLFYEISTNPLIHDNLFMGNGVNPPEGSWGANGGLSISSSHGAKVYHNIFVDNLENLQFREQARSTPVFYPDWTSTQDTEIWNHHNAISNNYFLSTNNKPHVRGWFGTLDARHWPRNSQARPLSRPVSSPTGRGPLENLALSFTGNAYSTTKSGSPAVVWGPSWSYHERYQTLADGQRFLGIFGTERELPATDLVPVIKAEMLKMGPFINSYAWLVN